MERLEMLSKRFRVFSYIVRLDGVKYDEVTNHVYATLSVWYDIMKWDGFGMAYIEFGDLDWTELRLLFHASETEDQEKTEIIEISDDVLPHKPIIDQTSEITAKLDILSSPSHAGKYSNIDPTRRRPRDEECCSSGYAPPITAARKKKNPPNRKLFVNAHPDKSTSTACSVTPI